MFPVVAALLAGRCRLRHVAFHSAPVVRFSSFSEWRSLRGQRPRHAFRAHRSLLRALSGSDGRLSRSVHQNHPHRFEGPDGSQSDRIPDGVDRSRELHRTPRLHGFPGRSAFSRKRRRGVAGSVGGDLRRPSPGAVRGAVRREPGSRQRSLGVRLPHGPRGSVRVVPALRRLRGHSFRRPRLRGRYRYYGRDCRGPCRGTGRRGRHSTGLARWRSRVATGAGVATGFG